jgi:AcrR family transcriptional regulator
VSTAAGRPELRDRVLAAVLARAGRDGLARITVDAVATEAGVSRASVYRWFPGGREQLIDEGVTWEVARFLRRLARAVEPDEPVTGALPAPPVASARDFADRLVRGLSFAHRAITEHEVLQRLLETEPGAFLPQLHQTTPLVTAVIRDYLRERLAGVRLRPGVDVDTAADYLARMVLSFMATPGRWDLGDPAEVERLVADELLVGIVAADG